ncbi:MAG: GlyGly-CTERM sorting domain-containing protein, partial [Gammaproteobacteria bacterium]|nr:GlyGly-CTERM sorting domain-containing protein [Gammaproteobacteria bacterium]
EAGTAIVKDIEPGSGSSHPEHLIAGNGVLYFTATNTTEGTELWMTDGTEAGTKLLSIVEGSAHISPIIKAVGDKGLFVNTLDKDSNSELYLISQTTNDALTFTSVTDTALNSVITSGTLNITGVLTDVNISITGSEYSLNGGAFTSAAGTAFNGDTLQLRTTSSTSYNMTTNVVVTIGDGVDTWSVTTMTDTVPDAFSFTDKIDVLLNTLVTSNTVIINGLGASAPISITGGEYSINGGAYTTDAGFVNNGDSVTLRTTSSTSYNTTTDVALNIGDISDTFTVITNTDTNGDSSGGSLNPLMLTLTLLLIVLVRRKVKV